MATATSAAANRPMTAEEKKVIFASSLGTVFEWYDFYLYGSLAAIIAKQFFAGLDPTSAFIFALFAFAAGFIVRPFGALFFGRLGDMIGRKYTFLVTILIMGLSTFVVGLLPNYASIGVAAPVILIVLRMLQGLALGGEYGGAATYVAEHAPHGRRGAYTSWIQTTATLGLFLSLLVILGTRTIMGEPAFNDWGWRIPFLLSAFVLIAGFIIRKEVHETPAFVKEEKQDKVAKSPISEAFRHSWKHMVLVMFMALMNVIPVVATIFGAAYAVQPAYGIGFDKSVYLWIPVVGNIVAVLVIPFIGNLSDKIGRRPTMIAGCLGSGLLAFVYLYAISIQNVPMAFAASIVMWGMVYQGYNAVFPSFYPELFHTRYRVSAMAIAQNIGTMLTAMLPALFALVAPPGSDNIPLVVGSLAFFITCVCALAAYIAPETHRLAMEDLGNPNAKPMEKAAYEASRKGSFQAVSH